MIINDETEMDEIGTDIFSESEQQQLVTISSSSSIEYIGNQHKYIFLINRILGQRKLCPTLPLKSCLKNEKKKKQIKKRRIRFTEDTEFIYVYREVNLKRTNK